MFSQAGSFQTTCGPSIGKLIHKILFFILKFIVLPWVLPDVEIDGGGHNVCGYIRVLF